MIRYYRNIYIVVLLLSFSLSCTQKKFSNLDYVDPTIGSVGVILEPTRPTVHLPNSVVRVVPIQIFICSSTAVVPLMSSSE